MFPMIRKPKIIVIVGPTASGKSDLAVWLAKRWGGEGISADSRQVYHGMDIGTGKITKKEMCGVPHHLLGVVSPKYVYTVADYKRDAGRVLKDILKRGKIPIICGGTGFYIRALVDNLILPDVPPDLKLRKRLEKKTAPELFTLLKGLDPARAKTIDIHNPRRLIRAIEIARTLGKVPPRFLKSDATIKIQVELRTRKLPPLSLQTPYDTLFLGIHLTKEELARRIDRRLRKRMKNGMINEVRRLHKAGVSRKRMEDLGLEYRFCSHYLKRKLTKEELLEQLGHAIKKYAKRQMTWFKKDKRVFWIDWIGRDRKEANRFVKEFLGKGHRA